MGVGAPSMSTLAARGDLTRHAIWSFVWRAIAFRSGSGHVRLWVRIRGWNCGLGCGLLVVGFGIRDSDLGFRVWGLEFTVQGLALRG